MAGCVCNTMNKGLLFVCVVAVLWSASAGQGTYHRSCDCDYTKDGRCIYSLAIPTCSGCSDNMCSAGDSLAEVQTTLNQLANNLTQQALYSGDQARMLNTLQNMLLEQQTTLQQLRMESGNNDNDNSCAQCESLQNQIESQQTVIENLQESISAFQSSMSDVSSQILSITETVSQGTQIDEFIEALQEQQTEFSNSIDNLVNMMHGSAAGYWMCHQKSLLVSGALANISDTAITASSMAEDAAKVRIRPYMVLDAALMPGWCPGEPNDNEWIQFDFNYNQTIFAILTKGRFDYAQWVTTYKIAYAVADEPTADDWMEYQDVLGATEVFQGNMDQDTLQMNTLWQPIMARWLRIYPLTANPDGVNQCLRADVLGCVDQLYTPTMPTEH